MNLTISKRTDPIYEACAVLNGRASALRGGERYLCGAAAAAGHYLQKLRATSPDEGLVLEARRLAGADERENEDFSALSALLFEPAIEIEKHVLSNLGVSDDWIKRYFGAPESGMISLGRAVSELREAEIGAEEAAAYIYGINNDKSLEADGGEVYARLSISEFINLTKDDGLADEYRLTACEVLADWENKRREINGVVERAAALVSEKSHLGSSLVAAWYDDISKKLSEMGPQGFLSESFGVKLRIDRDLTIVPSVQDFMSAYITMLPDELAGLRREVIEQGSFNYGVLVDFLKGIQSRGGNAQRLQGMLRALGDKQRFKIMTELIKHPMYTSDIIKLTGLSAATVSHHMSELLGEGFIEMSDEGNRIVNSVSEQGCKSFVEAVEDMFRFKTTVSGDMLGSGG